MPEFVSRLGFWGEKSAEIEDGDVPKWWLLILSEQFCFPKNGAQKFKFLINGVLVTGAIIQASKKQTQGSQIYPESYSVIQGTSEIKSDCWWFYFQQQIATFFHQQLEEATFSTPGGFTKLPQQSSTGIKL